MREFKGWYWARSGAAHLGLVLGHDGTAITQATIDTITVETFDTSASPPVSSYSATLTVSDVIFDTLQTSDPRWPYDAGFNFLHELPASALPLNDHEYRTEYTLTPVDGEVIRAVYCGPADAIYSS